MRELSLYRSYKLAANVRILIHEYAEMLSLNGVEVIKLMNFCGTHEWTTVHYGLRSLMPEEVELVAGPGCPVCVTPSLCVEQAIELSLDGVTVYTFGDAFRLPATREVRGVRSLREAKALGGRVKIVYSFMDAIRDAARRDEEAVFLAIGFETTAPSYAIPMAKGLVPRSLKLLSALRLTPPAARHAILAAIERGLDPVRGIVAPGHVSTVTGAKPWDSLSRALGLPAVISGFEPVDLLLSVAILLRMLYQGRVGVEIEYKRLVTWEGNILAKRLIREVFKVHDAAWRGLGIIPESGLELAGSYAGYDAYREYGLRMPSGEEDMPSGCRCSDVILGLAKPTECPLFMKACTPSRPYGPCMVSSEGTCAIWARFGGGGLAEKVAREVEA